MTNEADSNYGADPQAVGPSFFAGAMQENLPQKKQSFGSFL
ncbi:MAG: hypothetical protein JWM11_7257 [Planctomycetaceae bacterium]|nr:hypothetical protein [Planctomycetaceae bacterium]